MNGRADKSSQVLSKLNHELRKELEEKDRDFEREKNSREEIESLYQQEIQANKLLKKQLERRDVMLTNSLLAHDVS